jgi:hypothetical protein
MDNKTLNHSADIASRILAERKRQYSEEGWSLEHDDGHDQGELAEAAVCYALGKTTVSRHLTDSSVNLLAEINLNPFEVGFREAIKNKPRIRQLEIAGAFIIAEIERLERAAKS